MYILFSIFSCSKGGGRGWEVAFNALQTLTQILAATERVCSCPPDYCSNGVGCHSNTNGLCTDLPHSLFVPKKAC